MKKMTSPMDRETFGAVVHRYGKAIFNVAYRIVNDYEDAMDITQTTFTKTYERLDRYDPSHNIFNWLYKIAVHESINFAKHRSRTVPLDDDFAPAPETTDETCIQNETSKRIQTALMTIPPDYRTVVVLRHFHDLSYAEIAAVLDIPEKTVKSRLFSGRRMLRDSLLKTGYAP
jgi:RNA polymerase sigma-70 factor (ECF subfamily)